MDWRGLMYKIPDDELRLRLAEQVAFLVISADLFDKGLLCEARRISLALRILLHDTKNSQSLLSLCNKKDIKFFDTSFKYTPENRIMFSGLTVIGNDFRNQDFIAPLREDQLINRISFSEWWNENIIVKDTKLNKFTRKELVLAIANKDGGAHIDTELNENYADISRRYSIKAFHVGKSDENLKFQTPIELASIRQIAFEVLATIGAEFTDLPQPVVVPRLDSNILLGDIGVTFDVQPVNPKK